MATFCGKCGAKLEDGVKFCPSCGAIVATAQPEPTPTPEPTSTPTPTPQQNDFGAKVQGVVNTADTTGEYDKKDIEDNKVMAMLSYFGPLVFIPMFVKKDSKFCRFHAGQGLTLFLVDVAYGIVNAVLTAILKAIFPYQWTSWITYSRGFVYNALTTVLSLIWIPIGILAILGLINALNGKAKQLPIIGKIDILGKFFK